MKRKGFTLIELIVVIAIIGILILLAGPKYKEYTKEAKLTEIKVNVKEIENASLQYYMRNNDWPRLGDEPYTSQELETYAERVRDKTGSEVVLDSEGNYYDIDYSKLKNYLKEPKNKENYILRNPVGSVYYLEDLTDEGKIVFSSGSSVKSNGPLRQPNENEIQIYTAEDLNNIRNNLSESYILMNNIDLSSYENWESIGNSSSFFTGSFDGNGYIIRNLNINRPTHSILGLFGYISGAELSNISLEGVNITGGSFVGGLVGYNNKGSINNCYSNGNISGGSRVGGLVGYNYNAGSIESSHAKGVVDGSSNDVGGLVGANYNSTIKMTYATCTVSGLDDNVGGLVGSSSYGGSVSMSYATGNVNGLEYSVGGLIGRNTDGARVENSFATGDVSGKYSVGGLVGENWGSASRVTTSYSIGKVTGSTKGGLVGRNAYYVNSPQPTVSNSYWNIETSGMTSSYGSTSTYGRTTEQMYQQSTYNGWDFTNIWTIKEGQSYPTLRWQNK